MMRIIAVLTILVLPACAGGEFSWREVGRGWVDSVCLDAQSTSDYCRSRGFPSPGLGRY